MLPSASRSMWFALCVMITILFATVTQASEDLNQIKESLALHIDQNQVSVSGVSSGGWMAVQLHIAHSKKIMGVGVLAGGPYHCAGSPSIMCDYTPYGFSTPHDTCQALHICTKLARKTFGIFGLYIGPPDPADSVASALAEAADSTIDPIVNLKGDRVWLFSGRNDSLVPKEVMDQLYAFYAALFVRAEIGNSEDSIKYEKHEAAEHAMIVAVPGPTGDNNCSVYGPPFINDCDYPAAGELLKFIYRLQEPDSPAPNPEDWDQDALYTFDQTAFFDSSDQSVSMNDVGHIYVPQACQNGDACPLHIALHGCEQYQERIHQVCQVQGSCPALYFFKHAGYNEWAERHNIVVLYPQTMKWGHDSATAKNPKGCWDWWGYSGGDYFRKAGKQVTTIDRMIDCLTGVHPCP